MNAAKDTQFSTKSEGPEPLRFTDLEAPICAAANMAELVQTSLLDMENGEPLTNAQLWGIYHLRDLVQAVRSQFYATHTFGARP